MITTCHNCGARTDIPERDIIAAAECAQWRRMRRAEREYTARQEAMRKRDALVRPVIEARRIAAGKVGAQ